MPHDLFTLNKMTPDTHYRRIGGSAQVRALVVRFYQIMDELPETYGLRKMHAADLKNA